MCSGCGATVVPQAVVCGRCGVESVAAKDDPLVGAEVGNYRVLSRLGIGGMGAVYAAVEKNIDKKVAIKVVHPHIARIAELPTLLAEAKAVNAISDRGIVDVHAFGALDDGRQYLVMELLEGESLDVLLQRAGQLDLDEIISIGDGILGVLEAAHAAGFVHRDIKPANVFIVRPKRGEPFIKLLDFGLAQRARTESAVMLGTPGYAAPEQSIAGAKIGPAADLYAVGCMLFEMATGRLPFTANDAQAMLTQHRHAERPSARALRPNLPAAIDALILSLMQVDPAERPVSAAAARQSLREAAPTKRSRAWLGLAPVALVLIAVAAWVASRPAAGVTAALPDPLDESVRGTAGEVRQSMREGHWEKALEQLSAARKNFPERKEWSALEGEARSTLRVAANEALGRGDFTSAETFSASLGRLEPLKKDDPLSLELQRAAFARANGMRRASGQYIDAYEYPNRPGVQPATRVDFKDAVSLCERAGKHLCTESEWQRACGHAFPYGEKFEAGKCMGKKKPVKAAVPTGAMEGCVSPEGVHDLSGNVAEWTNSEFREGAPQRVIRGGSFNQSDEKLSCTARDYFMPGLGGARHIGFRCCY
jgi:hypothetical protein